MKISISHQQYFGINFLVVKVNWKINEIEVLNFWPLKRWLKQAKNKIFWYILTIGEGSGIINLSWRRIWMAEKIMRDRLEHIEAQTWYRPYAKIHYIRKKIEKLEKKPL